MICKYDASLHEALRDEVIDRYPQVLRLWDRNRPLWPYLKQNLKWYLYKRVTLIRKARRETLELSSDLSVEVNQDDVLEVQLILDGLSKYDRWLLYNHYVLGFTLRELSGATPYSHSTILLHRDKALERCRNALESGKDT